MINTKKNNLLIKNASHIYHNLENINGYKSINSLAVQFAMEREAVKEGIEVLKALGMIGVDKGGFF